MTTAATATSFGSVVVATDFSADARLAASRAAQLAALPGVDSVQLLHVVDTPWLAALQRWAGLSESSRLALIDEARRSLAAQVAEIERACGHRFDSKVAVGPLLDTLVEGAAGADLLVIGAHGEHPVRDIAIGSTGERMLRKRRGAVLVVRSEPAGRYRRVLAPIDLSRHGVSVLRGAAAIAPGAQVDVLHTFEVPFESKLRLAGVRDDEIHRLRQHARAQAVGEVNGIVQAAGIDTAQLRRRIEHGYAPRVIVDAARDSQADLIVIGKHGESIVEDLLLGSVTLHVLGEARCDVLVVSPAQP